MFRKAIASFIFLFAFSQFALAKPESAQNLMIAGEGPHAIDAGLRIAKAGGNIVDVAVATAFAMAVELPDEVEELSFTKRMIKWTEYAIGHSATSEDFIRACDGLE